MPVRPASPAWCTPRSGSARSSPGWRSPSLPARFGYAARVLVAALGLAVLSLPLLVTDTIPRLFVVVLVLGFVVAPYMISVFMLGERAAPASRVGAAMTLLAGATGIGYAVGSAVAGRLADEHGHTGAFAVTVTAAASAAVLAAASQPLLRRIGARDSPEAGAGTAAAAPPEHPTTGSGSRRVAVRTARGSSPQVANRHALPSPSPGRRRPVNHARVGQAAHQVADNVLEVGRRDDAPDRVDDDVHPLGGVEVAPEQALDRGGEEVDPDHPHEGRSARRRAGSP